VQTRGQLFQSLFILSQLKIKLGDDVTLKRFFSPQETANVTGKARAMPASKTRPFLMDLAVSVVTEKV